MKLTKMIIAVGVALFSLSGVGNIRAEIKADAFALTPFIGGYLFEGDQNLKHRPTYGLGFGYAFDKNWGGEAVFNYVDTDYDTGSGDMDVYLYRLDGLYHFHPFEKLIPYVAAGIGGITFDAEKGCSDTDPILNYGAGVKYFLTDTVALRGDVRHIIGLDDTENNLAYTVGLTICFGGEKQMIASPRTDSDGDGVDDDMDKCPRTPAGVSVDGVGCPLDSDGDGVPDYLDQCPRTPKGATVNEVGCWVCKGVEFDFDKWDIKPQYYPNLDEAVKCMEQHSSIHVEIQGHTDNIGTEEYNQRLSEKRAKAVMDYFVKEGITQERLSAVGYGLSRPVATNETPEGRAMNRRVQLKPIYDF